MNGLIVQSKVKSVETFYPRSFNMGIKKEIFNYLGGFPKTKMWPGEDMILAIELKKRNYNLQYIHEAYVYHKRRTSLHKFFEQVESFGRVRVYISQLYPDTFKIIYLFPIAFTLWVIASVIGGLLVSPLILLPLVLYFSAVFLTSSYMNQSLMTGLLSIVTTLIQFIGYAITFVYILIA